MKKKLHQRKRLKPWSEATKEQKAQTRIPKAFTPEQCVVAFVTKTNSEIMVTLSEEGECNIRMFREIGKDVFVHEHYISIHGAKALFTALDKAFEERYGTAQTKTNEE